MGLEENSSHEKPLRVVLPKLYNYLVKELESFHVHAYDIQANAVEKDSGYQIMIHYGEGFSQLESQFFFYKSINNLDESITEYIGTIGEKCKQVMVADYFKMMKMD